MKLSKIKEFMDNHNSKRISCTIERFDDIVKACYIYMTPDGNKRMTRRYKSIELDIGMKNGGTILQWDKKQNPNRFGAYLKYINYYDRREVE